MFNPSFFKPNIKEIYLKSLNLYSQKRTFSFCSSSQFQAQFQAQLRRKNDVIFSKLITLGQNVSSRGFRMSNIVRNVKLNSQSPSSKIKIPRASKKEIQRLFSLAKPEKWKLIMNYEDRLKKLRILSVEDRQNRGDLIETFKILNDFYAIKSTDFFDIRESERRGKWLFKNHSNKSIRSEFFTQRVIHEWNELPKDVRDSKTINEFKNRLDKHKNSGVTMAIPFNLGKVIDIIYTGLVDENKAKTKENLNKVAIFLLCVFLIGGVCNFGRVYLMNISGQRITQRLRTNLYSSILRQEIAFFDKNKTGELINRLSADTQLVSQSVTMNISDGLRSALMVTSGIGMMFYVSPQLALVGLSVVPPVACMAIIYGRFVRKISKQVQDSLAAATQTAEERISNIRTVRSFGQEEKENRLYCEKNVKILELGYRESLARGIFFGMTGLSGNFIILSVLYYGGGLVTENLISVGNLSSFLLYSAYVGVAMGGLSSFYSEVNKGLGATTRIWEIIDREASIPIQGGLVPSSIIGNIKLSNLDFAYPNRSDALIFKNASLNVEPGSVIAVVGHSGSGKSTLASLLLRFYDAQSGSITIDGNELTDLDPYWIRQNVGYVSQEPILFSCSIKDNILYGCTNPDEILEARIHEVAHESNALEFIRNFPKKFDTLVGERGILLSGGQKQRIAIARALIKDPKILIFDEATSALDAQSEYAVQIALERVMGKNRTCITIAHRLSTIKNADKIAVLSDGAFVEVGTFEELMAIEDGIFRKLVEKQTIQQ